jgi:DNA polymerase I-like protein with 3'-5' exonuclease and polymerase domains
MVDFVSHEPRVALCLGGFEPPQDIYDWFREERMSGYSRDAVKNTIISTLYGMSSASLSERLQCTLIEARAVNEIVRQGFNLPELEKGLSEQMRTYSHILSYFGRRVTPSSSSPGVVVNSYLQSTAFDAAMLGFRTILSRLAASLVEVSALFYIHDALVLEVSERDEDRLRSICSAPIEMKGFPGKYWTKVKEVTE